MNKQENESVQQNTDASPPQQVENPNIIPSPSEEQKAELLQDPDDRESFAVEQEPTDHDPEASS